MGKDTQWSFFLKINQYTVHVVSLTAIQYRLYYYSLPENQQSILTSYMVKKENVNKIMGDFYNLWKKKFILANKRKIQELRNLDR